MPAGILGIGTWGVGGMEKERLGKVKVYGNWLGKEGLAPQRLTTASDQHGLVPAPQCKQTLKQQCNEPSSSTHVQDNLCSADNTTNHSMSELELLFSPMFSEYFKGENKVVSKPSNFSDKSNTTQSTTTPIAAEEPPLIEMCFFALTISKKEPKNIKEAMADHVWIEAMQEELHQLDRHSVWEIVDKPFGKTVIGLKWFWKNKKDEESIVIRNKARLVDKGYH
nr:Gag-Pol polyprotein [Tanacetum cinerariifolium]